MIDLDTNHLLFIEPAGAPSAMPTVDEITRKFAGAWRGRKTSDYAYGGYHECTGEGCDARSDPFDHWVDLLETNSLALHYLAFHRSEVPAGELAKIAALAADEAEPTQEELTGLRYVGGDPELNDDLELDESPELDEL